MRKARQNVSLSMGRWAAYAAAGAGAAAAVSTAEADIQYSGIVNISVRGVDGVSSSILVPLQTLSGPATVFAVARHFSASGTIGVAQFGAYGLVNGFAAGGFLYASNLPYGANISTQPFSAPPSYFMTMAWVSGFTYSEFLNPGIGYLGFTFDLGGGPQYGWVRVDMDGAPYNGYTIIDYAHGMVGDVVHVGEIPEPGTLGMLALGALGVLAARRRTSKAA